MARILYPACCSPVGGSVDHGLEQVLQIGEKAAAAYIFFVDTYLVRPDDFAVVALRVVLAAQYFFFVAVLDGGRPGDARSHAQDDAVLALQLVGVPRDIRTGADETHVADEDVP